MSINTEKTQSENSADEIACCKADLRKQMKQILFFNEHPPVIDEKFHEDVEKIRNFFN